MCSSSRTARLASFRSLFTPPEVPLPPLNGADALAEEGGDLLPAVQLHGDDGAAGRRGRRVHLEGLKRVGNELAGRVCREAIRGGNRMPDAGGLRLCAARLPAFVPEPSGNFGEASP
jgi:hypothetical protein